MLLIHATVDLKPETQAEAVPACIEHAKAGLSEPGCSGYRFTLDLEKPARLHVLEHWESEEAITAHMHTPRSEKFAKLMSEWAQSVSVTRYKVLEDQSDEFRRQSETLMGDTVQEP
jgi:quinol monooxygenase YgiN